MKAKTDILYYKQWFWSLFVLSFVLLILSICVLQFEEDSLRIEIVLSSIVLNSSMLLGTVPYFINTINNRSNLLSKISLTFYIFIIFFCILSIVFNGILIHKIKSKTEEKYESIIIVILSSFLFLLYLINLIIETKMKISIHDTVQNFKKYRMKQQDQYVETKEQILLHTDEGDKKQPIYIRKEDGSTTTENSKSIISNFKKYWRNDDQYQFIKTEELIHGEPAYIKIKKGEPVSYTITLSPTGSHRNVAHI